MEASFNRRLKPYRFAGVSAVSPKGTAANPIFAPAAAAPAAPVHPGTEGDKGKTPRDRSSAGLKLRNCKSAPDNQASII
jgi:hypothetical protein